MNKTPRLDKMFWDNDVYYEGGIPQTKLPLLEIPRDVAHVKHLTWLSNEKSKKKYEYNLKHIGVCSYKWDYDNDKLIFDEEYYKDKEMPTIYED